MLCFFILGVITLNHSLRAEEFDLRGKFMPVQAAIMVNQAKQDSPGKPLKVWRLVSSGYCRFDIICNVQSECGSYVQRGTLRQKGNH